MNMGSEENALYRNEVLFFKEYRDKQQTKLIQEAHQHRKAVWLLADYSIPPDTRQMARSWCMEQVMMEMWRNAFIAGWRAAHKEVEDGQD